MEITRLIARISQSASAFASSHVQRPWGAAAGSERLNCRNATMETIRGQTALHRCLKASLPLSLMGIVVSPTRRNKECDAHGQE